VNIGLVQNARDGQTEVRLLRYTGDISGKKNQKLTNTFIISSQ